MTARGRRDRELAIDEELGKQSFPASDPPQAWTWEIVEHPAGEDLRPPSDQQERAGNPPEQAPADS